MTDYSDSQPEWADLDDDHSANIPPEFRDLRARERKLSVRDLWDRYMQGKLNLQAEFQREYVWDDTRASRFIESLLLNLPVPSIFVAENADGTWEVVDGHQRLESLFGFLQPLAAGPSRGALVSPRFKALRLRDLEVLHHDLTGCKADALSGKDRGALLDRVLTVVSIPKDADRDLRFVLFARLNLGSVALNAQELRNCVYRGPYNHLIRELAVQPDVMSFFGRKTPHKRMLDRELVLRFFALAHRRGQYRTPYSGFLNDEMEANQNSDPRTIDSYRREFLSSMEWTKRVFQAESCRLFRRGDESDPHGRWDRWTLLVYEVEMVGFSEFREQLDQLLPALGPGREDFLAGLRSKLIEILSSDSFLGTLGEGTKRPEKMALRFNLWTGMLGTAVEHPDFICEEGQFIRGKLHTTCAMCPSPVDMFDDAVRVRQGDTPRLAHRYCHRRWLNGQSTRR